MIGKQVANYRIVEKLGEGGMGVVYKAVDETLDRTVAIKILSSELTHDPQFVERFRAEAKAQAHLNHTNIATLYSLLVQEGDCYMVMEFVEGESFEQMIRRRGPVPYQDAIPLFKQVLLGLGFAHRMGIIHRDIKPGNMMANRSGIVKVMDFGIAKVMGGRRLTRTGTQVGTVYYMSPEQIRGATLDVRSDIYALGVMFYEMLTAHLPFESENDFQVMSDHVNTPPPLPSRYYPYLPKGVENAVLKALEKDPNARFQSVEEFGAALEHPETFTAGVQPAVTPAAGLRPTVMEGPASPPAFGPGISPQPPLAATAPGRGAPAPSALHMPPTAVQPAVPAHPSFWTRGKLLGIGGGALAVLVIAIVAVVAMRQPNPRVPGVGNVGGGTSVAMVNPSTTSGPTLSPPQTGNTPAAKIGEKEGEGNNQPLLSVDQVPGLGGTPGSATGPGAVRPGGTPPPAVRGPVPVRPDQLRAAYTAPPVYPPEARQRGITGSVQLQARISESGMVEDARVISGDPLLGASALKAVRSWRYQPYRVNNQPVKVVTTLNVPFQLSATEMETGRMLENAESAFQSGRLVDPPDTSALYYARKARQMDPSNAAAPEMERRVLGTMLNRVQAARQARSYNDALDLVNRLTVLFPERSDLYSLKQSILQEQQQVAREVERQGIEASIKRFTFQHRHKVMDQQWNVHVFYCVGTLTILPDGSIRYDCTGTNDPTGRCDRLMFPPGSINQVKTNTDGSLHLAVKGAGNYDFYGDAMSIQGAYQAISSLSPRKK